MYSVTLVLLLPAHRDREVGRLDSSRDIGRVTVCSGVDSFSLTQC